jgi:probable HAF family extracellular repeat protein
MPAPATAVPATSEPGRWQPATSTTATSFTPQDLGTLGGDFSTAADLNATGQVVGTSTTTTGADHAFLWDPATRRMVDLGTLGELRGIDYSFRSEATGLNDRGQVVGNSCAREGVYSCMVGTATGHGFTWDPATQTMTDLGTLGGASSAAAAVNDLGLIAGTSVTASGQSHALLWTRSTPPVMTVAVTASADTTVAQVAKGRNFGSSVGLATRGSTWNALISYLRFPLPQAPTGKTLSGVPSSVHAPDTRDTVWVAFDPVK